MSKTIPRTKRAPQLGRRHWSATSARKVLAAQGASGQSVAAFARGQGFRPQRLLWWRKRLADWGGEVAAAPLLVPAVTVGRASPVRPPPSLGRGRPVPQVTLRVGKLRVEICDALAVSPSWLAALVQELGVAR